MSDEKEQLEEEREKQRKLKAIAHKRILGETEVGMSRLAGAEKTAEIREAMRKRKEQNQEEE